MRECPIVAGNADTPLVRKLGVKEGTTLSLVHAPRDFVVDVDPSVRVRRSLRAGSEVVLAFFRHEANLEREITDLGAAIHPSSSLWVAWPKRSSGVTTDLTDHVVRTLALANGLVDNKVCAIDTTWTALRLVWRLEGRRTRPGGPASTRVD